MGSGECAKKPQTLDASDKTTCSSAEHRKGTSQFQVFILHLSISQLSKTLALTITMRQASQLQATTNLKFLHLPFQSHSLH